MHLLRLSIQQTYGQIGIETALAQTDIHSPPGQLIIEQPSAILDIYSPRGELTVDSSDALAAYARGGTVRWGNFIYTQMKGVALQAIAKIVDEGNRMAQISNPRNAFAEIAQSWNEHFKIDNTEPASFNNVKLDYKAHAPEIRFEPQHPLIQYEPQKPDVQYIPGKVDIYMKQMYSIDMSVSEYDWYK